LVVLVQFALFLFIGVALACYYSVQGTAGSIVSGDQAFVTFIVHDLPTGLSGLVLAAALAAAISSSLNSLASSLMSDWLGPRLADVDDRKAILLARWLTILFAAVQGAVAIGVYQLAIEQAVVDTVLKVAGFATGLILGLYALGLLAPRMSQAVAIGAFAVGVVVTCYAAFATPLNGYWYTLVGAGTILVAGLTMHVIGLLGKLRFWLLALTACALTLAIGAAEGASPGIDASIDAAVERALARGEMAGCVVVVGGRNGIVFERAYGHRQLEPEAQPMTVDTLFDMASLTKPLATATSVMILVERGQLRLQDKVADLIPEFAANGKQGITVEQLLIHSAGLIPDNPVDDYGDGWASAKAKICELAPIAPPGTKFKYSDVGFIVLGKIVELISGKSIDRFANDEIFAPLGMDETGYRPAEELKVRAAATEKRDGDWLVGVVHDPRAALMGGVAGHAGLFSTARDLATYAQMMLHHGSWQGARILGAATASEMTRSRNIDGNKRGLGWDMKSVYSKNRGETMSGRAFGHGGFTGTAMWIDPELDLFVIFLSNRLHPDGVGEVNSLAGRIGTIACGAAETSTSEFGAMTGNRGVKLGIDTLAADGFQPLLGKRVGLITNHTGCDGDGISTARRLHDAENVKLVALFSPEHGIAGTLDTSHIHDSFDDDLGVPVYSLYGPSRKPTRQQVSDIDVLVFDIQDIGTRFYTYIATMGLAMEAAAEAGREFVVLDRPNPIGGQHVEGPLRDASRESFVGYYRLPVRHGMTVGELARMFAAEKRLDLKLTVIPLSGWQRQDYWHDTDLAWVNPSPNMRCETAAVLYPGIGLLETTNVSVGRGTDTPFEVMGAPWIRERELAKIVNRASPPGVRVIPIHFTPTASKFAGDDCRGLNFVITDWRVFRSFELGLIVADSLRTLHPDEWKAEGYLKLLGNEAVYRRLMAGEGVAPILKSVDEEVTAFCTRRAPFLLYP
jgi:uncharacterized protein YbbC (DUF1343 family)